MSLMITWIIFLLVYIYPLSSVWTGFDFVRTKINGYGSEKNIPYVKISPLHGNGPQVPQGANFGSAIANIGDLDGNGVDDLVVGASAESNDDKVVTAETSNKTIIGCGAVYILFMNEDGTVLNNTRISASINGGPYLSANDQFGSSVASIGDLDKDGINEIAVGAPGIFLAGVHVLYMFRNGTVRKNVLIRGKFIGASIPSTANFTLSPIDNATANGPPIKFASQFGASLGSLGDFNNDGTPDLAVGSLNSGTGECLLYLLFLSPNATVLNYTIIGDGYGGGPILEKPFSGFASSVVSIGDINRDGVTDLAVGAKNIDYVYGNSFSSGAIYIFLMHANGTVLSYHQYGQEQRYDKNREIPLQSYDQCGYAVTCIGDINRDNVRQQHPEYEKEPPRLSVNDVVMGCPQGNADGETGKLFLMFLSVEGNVRDFTEIPAATDVGIAPDLQSVAQFGYSLAGVWDLDGTGISGIAVGSPGDDDGGASAGAIYLIFLRRRRFHPKKVSLIKILVPIVVPAFCSVFFCCLLVALFFWYFRRKPDDIEIIVKKSGLEISKQRRRKKLDFIDGNKVYADEYVM